MAPATKAQPRIVTAKHETCPDCGSELGKGIMAEYRKLHPGGARCPECPQARHDQPKPKPTERARRVARIQKELAAEAAGETVKATRGPRRERKGPMALTPEVLADPRFISPGTRQPIERKRSDHRALLAARGNPGARAEIAAERRAGLKADTRIRATVSTNGAHRLKAGGLQEAVLRFVEVHSDEEWSPTAIAGAIGRSSGAIANALAKHERDGKVRCTSTQPRRYQAAPK